MSRFAGSRLRLDPVSCTAHGLCAQLLAERIRLDEWGYPIVDSSPLPADLEEHARLAARECPTRALRLTRSR
jgi:ferredoxin